VKSTHANSSLRPPRADGRLDDWPDPPAGESELFDRLRDLCDEGLGISARLDESRAEAWSSFVPADYDTVLSGLMRIRDRGGRFLEFGSATGVVAIMADLLGLEACGIEIAPELVSESRGLADRYGSSARFATGSFLPEGYQFVAPNGDTRIGAVGVGEPAYPELGYQLADFDWVYAYPWPGESEVLLHLMKLRGGPRATLLLHGYTGVLEFHPPL
jgi:hypothetical protein